MVKPISRREWNKLVKQVREALHLASTHDPEHEIRLSVIERQLEHMGAPQYRRVR